MLLGAHIPMYFNTTIMVATCRCDIYIALLALILPSEVVKLFEVEGWRSTQRRVGQFERRDPDSNPRHSAHTTPDTQPTNEKQQTCRGADERREQRRRRHPSRDRRSSRSYVSRSSHSRPYSYEHIESTRQAHIHRCAALRAACRV
jgi:hypothetical protein